MANKSYFRLERKAINSKYAGQIMNQQIRKRLVPVFAKAARLLQEYVQDWSAESKVRFSIATSGSGLTVDESTISIAVALEGTEKGKLRWRMVDTEGREGGATIRVSPEKLAKGSRLPIRTYIKKTGNAAGGVYVDKPITFMTEVKQGDVEPRFYSDVVKKAIAGDTDSIKKGSIMYKAIRNGYRAAGRRLTGNPNF